VVLRRFGRRDDVIVASFLDAATDAFSAYAPEIPTSAGTQSVAAFYQAVVAGEPPVALRHAALQVPRRVGELEIVNEAFIAAAHRAGLAVHVWTIDDEREMRELVDLGVDGIISDLPTALDTVLSDNKVKWLPSEAAV
jgi:glycerophosphoryl diester phosphodiesterase